MTNYIGESYFKDMKLKEKQNNLPKCDQCCNAITSKKYQMVNENFVPQKGVYLCFKCYGEFIGK